MLSSTAVSHSTPLLTDDAMPAGMIHGFDADGALIVCTRYRPVLQRLVGTETDAHRVVVWHIASGGARHIAAIAAWNATPGQPVAGYA